MTSMTLLLTNPKGDSTCLRSTIPTMVSLIFMETGRGQASLKVRRIWMSKVELSETISYNVILINLPWERIVHGNFGHLS